jgi:hypothetical protein
MIGTELVPCVSNCGGSSIGEYRIMSVKHWLALFLAIGALTCLTQTAQAKDWFADYPAGQRPFYGTPMLDVIVRNPYAESNAPPEKVIDGIEEACRELQKSEGVQGSEAIEGIFGIANEWGGYLISMGHRSTGPILDRLQHQKLTDRTRHILLWTLSVIKDPAAAPYARQVFLDTKTIVPLRASAAAVLASVNDAESKPAIEAMMEGVHVDTTTQRAVIQEISRVGWSDLDFLRKMAGLGSASWANSQTRRSATMILSHSSNPEAEKVLLDIIAAHPDVFAWESHLDDQAVVAERWDMLHALASRHDPRGSHYIADLLREALRSESSDNELPEKRMGLVQFLIETGGDDAVDGLIVALKASDARLVETAVAGLRKLANPRGYRALEDLVQGLPKDPRFVSMYDAKTGKPKPGNRTIQNIIWARDDLKKLRTQVNQQ